MSRGTEPPIIHDVVIAGDELRPRGLWLPLQPVQPESLSGRWPDPPPEVLEQAERLLPDVHERALRKARRTLRAALHDSSRQRRRRPKR